MLTPATGPLPRQSMRLFAFRSHRWALPGFSIAMPCRATAVPFHAEHSHRSARLCHRRAPLHVSSPCHCAATTCMPLLCLRRAVPCQGIALPCPRLALLAPCAAVRSRAVLCPCNARDCGAKPSHIGSVPPNANATLGCAVAPPCNATLMQYATVLIHRISVLCPAHPLPCVRGRALPMRINAEPCLAVAPQSLAVPLLGAPVLCFRVPTLLLANALLSNAERGLAIAIRRVSWLCRCDAVRCSAVAPHGSAWLCPAPARQRFATLCRRYTGHRFASAACPAPPCRTA